MSVQILIGDAREVLQGLPDASVNSCVTSPPYFGLRDYGMAGQMGLEQTPADYVAGMVELFRDARRVLRDDGVLWLNLGDSYSASATGQATTKSTLQGGKENQIVAGNRPNKIGFDGLKPKDLIGIPWRVAFALQADGWWLRGDHVWAKPNGMPESVTDRPTRGHEYFFLLSKSERYWYDAQAVRTAPKASTITRLAQNIEAQAGSERANGGAKTNGRMKAVGGADKQRGHSRRHAGFNDRWDAKEASEAITGSNLRSVWWIPPAQFREGHFAVMPDLAAEICIRSSCPVGGTVLDPFSGAGTTALVADRLQRDAIGIELNPEYASLAQDRIDRDRGGLMDLMEAAA